MKRGSLSTQLIVWNSVALALLLLVLGVIVRYTVATSMVLSINRSLDQRLKTFPPMFQGERSRHGGDRDRPGGRPPFDRLPGNGPGGPPPGGPGEGPPDHSDGPGGPENLSKKPQSNQENMLEPRHFDTRGTILGQRAMLSRESFAAALRTGHDDYRRVVVDGEPLQVLSSPMHSNGQITGVGQIGARRGEVEQAIASLDRTLWTLLPAGLLCAAAGGAFLTNRVLRRVRLATQAAEQISMQENHREGFALRLPVSGADEFSELATTINGLLGRLDSALQQQSRLLEQQRRFTADASHELKTPLTVIKGTASMALGTPLTPEQYREALTGINQASDTMGQLVKDLLLLARADSEQLGLNRIDLLVSEVVESAVRQVPHSGHSIHIEIADPALTVHGNENELIRVIVNLVDNAVRYSPPQTTITVTAHREGEHVAICVRDNGIGIAPEHLAHLGERFYRAEAARTREGGGTGLGLSICRSILAAHGGTLHFESEPGKGATATVLLPDTANA